MPMKTFITLLNVMFLFVALSAQTPEEEVDGLFMESIRHAENLDLNSLSEGVDDSHKAGFIGNGKYFCSYYMMTLDVKYHMRNVKDQKITIKEKRITTLSDTVVLVSTKGKATTTLNDGRVIDTGFLWSFVYKKETDGWKVVHSHQSELR